MIGFALPIIKFNKTGTVSEKEKRNLATKPYLFVDNRLNENFFTEYSAYFNDRIGGRQKLISLNAKMKYDVFRANFYNKLAIKGKHNWYFFINKLEGNNISDFNKTNLFNEEQIKDFSNNVKKTVEWCNEQNIPCVFLICPNKHSVYEEFYPFKRPKGITRTDQITEVFEKLHIFYIFPRDFLISQKSEFDFPLYIETDSHWNSQGAYLSSTLLRKKIEMLFPNIKFPQIEYKTELAYGLSPSDLPPILGIKEQNNTQVQILPIDHNNTDYYTYLKNDEMDGVHTQGTDKNLPRALIYRDSFFRALEPFVSPLFSEAEYICKQFDESDKEYVLQYKPDIIIFEAVERYAPTIVQ